MQGGGHTITSSLSVAAVSGAAMLPCAVGAAAPAPVTRGEGRRRRAAKDPVGRAAMELITRYMKGGTRGRRMRPTRGTAASTASWRPVGHADASALRGAPARSTRAFRDVHWRPCRRRRGHWQRQRRTGTVMPTDRCRGSGQRGLGISAAMCVCWGAPVLSNRRSRTAIFSTGHHVGRPERCRSGAPGEPNLR